MQSPISRRRYLGMSVAAATLCGVQRSEAFGTEAPGAFIEKYSVPGLSFCIAKKGEIAHTGVYGYADKEKKIALTAEHTFRIASVSKPITSSAVFLLVERGKLKLEDLVFGDGGVLGMAGPEGITVRHLLTHTSGGWKNDITDPMFRKNTLGHQELIEWTLEKLPPNNPPGKKYAYSNFGYCLLGRVIEKATGETYEDFVRANVLKLCNAEGMVVGKREREVNYYKSDGKPEKFAMNVARMDAHGGWVGTPTELVEFAMRVDGFAEPADLLKMDSLVEMTKRDGVNQNYACGWSVNKVGNYWHGGSLPGLSTQLVRTNDGFCWAACANTRQKGIGLALDRLMWKLARELKD